MVRLVREVAGIAKAAGVTLINEDTLLPLQGILSGSEDAAVQAVLQAGREFQRNAPTHRLSTLQDLEAGRPLLWFFGKELTFVHDPSVHDPRGAGPGYDRLRFARWLSRPRWT